MMEIRYTLEAQFKGDDYITIAAGSYEKCIDYYWNNNADPDLGDWQIHIFVNGSITGTYYLD